MRARREERSEGRYTWRGNQLWDRLKGCWVIWNCAAGIGICHDLQVRIVQALNAKEGGK